MSDGVLIGLAVLGGLVILVLAARLLRARSNRRKRNSRSKEEARQAFFRKVSEKGHDETDTPWND